MVRITLTIITILLFPTLTFAMTNTEVLHGVNAVRVEHEIAPLKRNIALNRAAQERADFIAETGKFEHGCQVNEGMKRCPF